MLMSIASRDGVTLPTPLAPAARKMNCVRVVRLPLVACSSEKWSLKMVSACHDRERKKARERGRADEDGDLTNEGAWGLRLGR